MNIAGIKEGITKSAEKCVAEVGTKVLEHPTAAIASGIALAAATFAAGRYTAPKCCGGKCDNCC